MNLLVNSVQPLAFFTILARRSACSFTLKVVVLINTGLSPVRSGMLVCMDAMVLASCSPSLIQRIPSLGMPDSSLTNDPRQSTAPVMHWLDPVSVGA